MTTAPDVSPEAVERHIRALRSTRANMLGTADEAHYHACHDAADALEALSSQLEAARDVLSFSRTALRIAEGAFMGVRDVFPSCGVDEHIDRCAKAVDRIDAAMAASAGGSNG